MCYSRREDERGPAAALLAYGLLTKAVAQEAGLGAGDAVEVACADGAIAPSWVRSRRVNGMGGVIRGA